MTAPLLDASDITFSYNGRTALRGVGVALRPGEVVTLIGPNGSGKSTLIKVLLGHLAGGGRIEWEGRALSQWRRRDLARRVAYLPQSPTYEPGQRVAEVLRLGRAPYWSAFGIESPRDRSVVERVARLLDLADLLDRPVEALSGGQRQRVFVGRCLVQEPAALLLDEPNTYLDLRHHVDLCRLLRELARTQNLGVLMASHDLNLSAAFTDRLVLLEDGAVAAAGEPSDVLKSDVLTRVYQLPVETITRGGGTIPVVLPVVDV